MLVEWIDLVCLPAWEPELLDFMLFSPNCQFLDSTPVRKQSLSLLQLEGSFICVSSYLWRQLLSESDIHTALCTPADGGPVPL